MFIKAKTESVEWRLYTVVILPNYRPVNLARCHPSNAIKTNFFLFKTHPTKIDFFKIKFAKFLDKLEKNRKINKSCDSSRFDQKSRKKNWDFLGGTRLSPELGVRSTFCSSNQENMYHLHHPSSNQRNTSRRGGTPIAA